MRGVATIADSTPDKFDLIVIGAGLAGVAATGFAAARGLKTAQAAATGGELTFASGLLDLLGVCPPHEQKPWEDPWAGLAALIGDSPRHPYAKAGMAAIRRAMEEFLAFAEAAHLSYYGWPDRNVTLLPATGTLKVSYRTGSAPRAAPGWPSPSPTVRSRRFCAIVPRRRALNSNPGADLFINGSTIR